ncbi:hypothetical protein LSAT2_031760, partial [Lamellibrachia satsuma]
MKELHSTRHHQQRRHRIWQLIRMQASNKHHVVAAIGAVHLDRRLVAQRSRELNLHHTDRGSEFELGEHEAWLHIDFAENWCCKEMAEVQAAHFGGSHSQVTLHTGVAYIGASENSKRAVSFCSLSDSMEHGPKAIWGHLKPFLLELKRTYPQLTVLHFMNDGPVPQYRGRGNMHLLANVPFDMG